LIKAGDSRKWNRLLQEELSETRHDVDGLAERMAKMEVQLQEYVGGTSFHAARSEEDEINDELCIDQLLEVTLASSSKPDSELQGLERFSRRQLELGVARDLEELARRVEDLESANSLSSSDRQDSRPWSDDLQRQHQGLALLQQDVVAAQRDLTDLAADVRSLRIALSRSADSPEGASFVATCSRAAANEPGRGQDSPPWPVAAVDSLAATEASRPSRLHAPARATTGGDGCRRWWRLGIRVRLGQAGGAPSARSIGPAFAIVRRRTSALCTGCWGFQRGSQALGGQRPTRLAGQSFHGLARWKFMTIVTEAATQTQLLASSPKEGAWDSWHLHVQRVTSACHSGLLGSISNHI
ncbi:unnamed protein product, partial [Polarella glacialis]